MHSPKVNSINISSRLFLRFGFPLLRESQVVIDVRDLTPEEKQQILYNHMKLGKQDREFRTDIKPYLPSIASQGQFVPETARRLADPLFTAELSLDRYHLHEFVEKQEHCHWMERIAHAQTSLPGCHQPHDPARRISGSSCVPYFDLKIPS